MGDEQRVDWLMLRELFVAGWSEIGLVAWVVGVWSIAWSVWRGWEVEWR